MNDLAVVPQSRYLTCEGREIHFMDWARAPGTTAMRSGLSTCSSRGTPSSVTVYR